MRLNLKPAAASAAAIFLLLLLLDLTWPGHGIWLLIVGLAIGLAAAWFWGQDRLQSDSTVAAKPEPFPQVGAYGLAGAQPRRTPRSPSGVPLAAVLAPISALAILLYVGGAIGASEPQATEVSAALTQEVSAIDRSGDGQSALPSANTGTSDQTQQTSTSTDSTSVTPPQNSATNSSTNADSSSQGNAAPVRPIVVAAPSIATPSDDDSDNINLAPESANTFEYQVVEGDTLYDIAVRYDTTVETIMNLNKLDAYTYIHPGDVLLIPQDEESAEES